MCSLSYFVEELPMTQRLAFAQNGEPVTNDLLLLRSLKRNPTYHETFDDPKISLVPKM
jgi:hypothetical protein